MVRVWQAVRHAPIQEPIALGITLLFSNLYFLCLFPCAILSVPNHIDPVGQSIGQFTYAFGYAGITAFTLVMFLPNFKLKYSSIALLITVSGTGMTCIVFNSLTIIQVVEGEIMRVIYVPAGLLLFGANILLLLLIIGARMMEISRIARHRTSPLPTSKFLWVFYLLFGAALLILLISRLLPALGLPGQGWVIPFSLAQFYFVRVFVRDPAFIFITPAKFEAIIVADEESTVPLFSQVFVKNVAAEELLSGLFTALNIRLKDFVQSACQLEQVGFGDKVVLISRGRRVVTLLIVSEKNLITGAISKFITREFEARFESTFQELGPRAISLTPLFYEFSSVIAIVRRYMPL